MTQEPTHHASGPLTVAVMLAAVAGFVDAHIFLHVTPVFVANMSGNMIRLGIDGGAGEWSAAVGSLIALVAFTSGVVVAVTHLDRRLRRGVGLGPKSLLGVESFLVLSLPVILTVSGTTRSGAVATPIADLVVLIAAFAMGLQAASLRRVGGIAVATTYGTGAIVRIGEKLALAARKADRATEHRRSQTIAVLVVVLMSYLGGAAVASAAGGSPWLLAIPGVVLAGIAVAGRAS